MKHFIQIKNAQTNNLKNVSVSIPLHKLTVITGPSGSGKSSLAFDTIFKEGQKRYLDSLAEGTSVSLIDLSPTDVEEIIGIPPAIAIDQNVLRSNPRSTVGTISEVYDLLRVLYSKVGQYKNNNGETVTQYTVQEIFEDIYSLPSNTKLQFCIKTDTSSKSLKHFLQQGFFIVLYENKEIDLDLFIKQKNKPKDCFIVIDRVILNANKQKRILDTIEKSLYHGKHSLFLHTPTGIKKYTTILEDEQGNELPELTARSFSFNSPLGACPHCKGLGTHYTSSIEELLDNDKEILIESIKPIHHFINLKKIITALLKQEKLNPNITLEECPKNILDKIFYGDRHQLMVTIAIKKQKITLDFPGIIPWLNQELHTTSSEKIKKSLNTFLRQQKCPICHGSRLNKNARSVYINSYSIDQLIDIDLTQLKQIIAQFNFSPLHQKIASPLVDNLKARLNYLISIGLNYLHLNRSVQSLSGGELQRLKLAAQLGTQLSEVLYVLDEPSIGLHSSDTDKLINTLIQLKNNSNTVIIVEHDLQIIQSADHIIDIGPMAGVQGGEIIYQGSYKNFYFPAIQQLSPLEHKQVDNQLTITGISQHNINNLDVTFPLAGITCITGVSGSGKSTLIHHVLVPAIKYVLNPNEIQYNLDNFTSISGHETIKSIIEIDQKPIGRSPKSTPITFMDLFTDIRKFFASLPAAQIKGYGPSHFSYNMQEGRCPTCEGRGQKLVEISLLPNSFILCETCLGGRFNSEVITIKYKGLSIADVLRLTVNQACDFFKYHKKIIKKLKMLQDTGLGYLTLGQSALTLSGGEAQRLKLAKHLAKTTKGRTLYILDEPSTGLHRRDIAVLIKILFNLAEQGHPIIIIEHNLDIIKIANHIIDMGPQGGREGGKIIAQGTIDDIIKTKQSLTGKWLKGAQ